MWANPLEAIEYPHQGLIFLYTLPPVSHPAQLCLSVCLPSLPSPLSHPLLKAHQPPWPKSVVEDAVIETLPRLEVMMLDLMTSRGIHAVLATTDVTRLFVTCRQVEV